MITFLPILIFLLGFPWAFFYIFIIVKMRGHRPRRGVYCWSFTSARLNVAEASHEPSLESQSELKLFWTTRTCICDGLGSAEKQLIEELGRLIKLPDWWPSWLPPRLRHDEELIMMKRGDYHRITNQIRANRRNGR